MSTKVISLRYHSSNKSFISGNIIDILNLYKNQIKQEAPNPPKINLSEYEQLFNRINGFRSLQSDWDSDNANAVCENSINVSIKILNHLYTEGWLSTDIQVNVFPMRNGGVQFEFDGEKICAELEIDHNGILTFILFDDDSNIIDKGQLFELSVLTTFLEESQYAF